MKNLSLLTTITCLLMYCATYGQKEVIPVLSCPQGGIYLDFGLNYLTQEIALEGKFLSKIDISSVRINDCKIKNCYINKDSTKLIIDVLVPEKMLDKIELSYRHGNKNEELQIDVYSKNPDHNKILLQKIDTKKIFPDEFFNTVYKISGDLHFWHMLNIKEIKLLDSRFDFSKITLLKNKDSLVIQGSIPYFSGILDSHNIILSYQNEKISQLPISFSSYSPSFDSITKEYEIDSEKFQTLTLTGNYLYAIDLNSIEIQNPSSEFQLKCKPKGNFTNTIPLSIKILNNTLLRLRYVTRSGESRTEIIFIPIKRIMPNMGYLRNKVYVKDIPDYNRVLKIKLGNTANGSYNVECQDIDFINGNRPITINNTDTCCLTILRLEKTTSLNEDLRTTIYFRQTAGTVFTIPILLRGEPKINKIRLNGKNTNELEVSYTKEYSMELLSGNHFEDIEFSEDFFKIKKKLDSKNKYTLTFCDSTCITQKTKYNLYYHRSSNTSNQYYCDSIPIYIIPHHKIFTDYSNAATFVEKELCKDNGITFLIDAKNIDYSYGFQNIKLKAKIYDENNNLINTLIYNDNNYNKFANPQYQQKSKIRWDLLKEMSINDYRPFNKIQVYIIPEEESGKSIDDITPIEGQIMGTEIDKWRIEPSIPAMIFMYSNKKIANDSASIANGGPDSLRYQILTGSLGFSIYRQFYKKNQTPTRFSLGAYFLTSNLLSTSNNENKIVNKYDFTIIPYFQFKLFSNDRAVLVPVFIGWGFSYNSKRDQWMYGFMAGISLNFDLKSTK